MNYAVIFAGGIGSRMMSSDIPKQFIKVQGMPILIHTILVFEKSDAIDGISVVCLENWIPKLREYIEKYGIKKVKWISPGGETGQQSIYNGLKAIYDDSDDPSKDIVLLNDGVRPFVSEELIETCISTVMNKGSAVAIYPVNESVVVVPDPADGSITDIPIKSKLFHSKSPLGFFLQEIMDAHHKAIAENRYDFITSAELMRYYGHSLYTFFDTPNNIKITTPMDIYLMDIMLEEGCIDEGCATA